MATASAQACYCGTGLEYTGKNKDTLHCKHCDRPCKTKDCDNCKASRKHWKDV